MYQFDNSLPPILPQESEHVSAVYPAFPFKEQLGQTVEKTLGPEIQTFERQANSSGPNQVREHCKRNHRVSEIHSNSISSWVRIAFHYPPATTHSNRAPIILQFKETISCSITPTSSTVHFHRCWTTHQVLIRYCTNKIQTKLLMLQSLQNIHRPRNCKIRRISGTMDVKIGGAALTITETEYIDDLRTLLGT